VSAEPAVDQDELARQVQRLAGRAFLQLLDLEESLKTVLAVLCQMGVGDLTPDDAKGILDGQKQLTSGQARSTILDNIEREKNLGQVLESAVKARNELVHQLPSSRWMVKNAAEFQALATKVKELTRRVTDGVDILRLFMRALIEVLLRERPHLCTPEMRNQLAQAHPNLTVTFESV
jgi:hypothetical protein